MIWDYLGALLVLVSSGLWFYAGRLFEREKWEKKIFILESKLMAREATIYLYRKAKKMVETAKKQENHCLYVVDKGRGEYEVEVNLSKGVDKAKALVMIQPHPLFGYLYKEVVEIHDTQKLNEAMKTGFLSEYVSQLIKKEEK